MGAPDRGGDAHTTVSLLRLMAWMSPAFPLGGFAWSGGLERAVADGLVSDVHGLEEWLSLSINGGPLHNDAILLVAAWRACGDGAALETIADLASALSPSAERHAETTSLGQAFIAAVSAWPHPVLDIIPASAAYPVAAGAVAGAHGIDAEQVLAAWLHASVSQSISAAIRLGVMGQRDGLRILAVLEEQIADAAAKARHITLDDLGSCSIAADTVSLKHETQSVRLFRS